MEQQEKNELTQKVQNIIEQIRPHLQADGGDIKFVSLTDDYVVEVELQGACQCCHMAIATMKNGVEATIKQILPEIQSVVALNMCC